MFFKNHPFDLQLFASIPGVEDDNPDKDDDDDFTEDDDDALSEDIEKLLGAGAEDDDEKEDGEDDKPKKGGKEKEKDAEPGVKASPSTEGKLLITQEEIDAIVESRLARDRKSGLVKAIESVGGVSAEELTDLLDTMRRDTDGMSLKDIAAQIRQNRVESIADEQGISIEDAKKQLDAEERASKAEAKVKAAEEREMTVTYREEKAKFISRPDVKRYEDEIDEVSKGGKVCSFEVAMYHVLGRKVLNGDLTKEIGDSVTRKVQRENAKRGSAPLSGGGVGGGKMSEGITKEERIIARSLGLTPEEFAEEKARMNQTRGRRGGR